MSDRALGTRFESAGDSPGLTLWRVTNRWQAAMRGALAPHELTHVQYVLLASLVWLDQQDREAPITQAAIAAFASTDVMMTSQVIRALAAKGFVRRTAHPIDGRARVVRPTSEGVAAAQHATIDVERADEQFLGRLHDVAGVTTELARLLPTRHPAPGE